MNHDFCVCILTHGRPDVKTTSTLRKCGYSGDIKYIIDNEDDKQQEYIDKYGDDVIVFNKELAEQITDTCDLVKHRKAVVFARNYIFQIMKDAGYKYFLVLDDDYTTFAFAFDEKLDYCGHRKIKDMDSVLDIVMDYYIDNKKLRTIAMAQGGDFIGGKGGSEGARIRAKRKAMNAFFCSVNRPFDLKGRINEDVNAYVSHGRKGVIMHQINQLRLEQGTTQQNAGGLTDIYLALGTYVKSFYSVMIEPSCVRVALMGVKNKRLHHEISWNNCTPKILREVIKHG